MSEGNSKMKTNHVVISFLGIGITDYRAYLVFAYLKPVACLKVGGVVTCPTIFLVCPDDSW